MITFHLVALSNVLALFAESREPIQPSADLEETSGKPHLGPQSQASECVCPSWLLKLCLTSHLYRQCQGQKTCFLGLCMLPPHSVKLFFGIKESCVGCHLQLQNRGCGFPNAEQHLCFNSSMLRGNRTFALTTLLVKLWWWVKEINECDSLIELCFSLWLFDVNWEGDGGGGGGDVWHLVVYYTWCVEWHTKLIFIHS